MSALREGSISSSMFLADEATAAAEAAPTVPDRAVDRAAEAVWVAAQSRGWSSLVIVPMERTAAAVALARAVAMAGSAQRGEPVEGLDLRGLPLAESRPHAERLADRSRPYRRVAVVDSPLESQTAVLLARAADAAVLVAERDRTLLADVRTVLERVGEERFVGAVMLEPK